MLANYSGKPAVANDPELIPVAILRLCDRTPDESRGVLNAAAVIEPWKPLAEMRPIAIDQDGQLFRIAFCDLAQFH